MNYLKIFKPLFFVAITICVVFFIIIILLPSHVIVSKTVTINADKEKVAAHLNDLNNWKKWFPLFQNKDIGTAITDHGDTTSAILINDNNKKRLLFILIKNNPDTIMVNLTDDDVKQTYQFTLLSVNENETRLTWDIDFIFNKYSLRKFTTIVMDKVKGPQYEDILNNLKKIIENNR